MCKLYWYPLYCYARRHGHQPEDAKDAVQGFFCVLLERELFAKADREKGKLRAFLLNAFKNFLADEWRSGQAAKRGGGKEIVSFDALDAETRYAAEPIDVESPDQLCDRRWAITLLHRAIDALKDVYQQEGKEELFAILNPYILVPLDHENVLRIAKALGVTNENTKMILSRLRERYRKAFRSEVAETVSSEAEVEEEMAALRAALG